MRRGILLFLAIFQTIMFAAHAIVLETWFAFWGKPASASGQIAVEVGVLVLSISFLAASLLSFRYWNAFTRNFYRFAAAWLGTLNFVSFAAVGVWLTGALKSFSHARWNNKAIVTVWFAM